MAFVRLKLVTDRKEQILAFWWPTVASFLLSHVGLNAFRSEIFVCDVQKCDVLSVHRDVILCVLAQSVRRSEETCCSQFWARRETLVQDCTTIRVYGVTFNSTMILAQHCPQFAAVLTAVTYVDVGRQ